jgi:hypothetical protein
VNVHQALPKTSPFEAGRLFSHLGLLSLIEESETPETSLSNYHYIISNRQHALQIVANPFCCLCEINTISYKHHGDNGAIDIS